MLKISLKMSAISFAALIAATAPAQAYIDPGVGSFILQAVIGSIAGGLFILKMYWAKFLSFLPGGRKADNRETDRAGRGS